MAERPGPARRDGGVVAHVGAGRGVSAGERRTGDPAHRERPAVAAVADPVELAVPAGERQPDLEFDLRIFRRSRHAVDLAVSRERTGCRDDDRRLDRRARERDRHEAFARLRGRSSRGRQRDNREKRGQRDADHAESNDLEQLR